MCDCDCSYCCQCDDEPEYTPPSPEERAAREARYQAIRAGLVEPTKWEMIDMLAREVYSPRRFKRLAEQKEPLLNWLRAPADDE